MVDARVAAPFADALIAHGAAVLTPDEADRFAMQAVDLNTGALRREFVGQSAATIAAALGIVRPYPMRLLVLRRCSRASDRLQHRRKAGAGPVDVHRGRRGRRTAAVPDPARDCRARAIPRSSTARTPHASSGSRA